MRRKFKPEIMFGPFKKRPPKVKHTNAKLIKEVIDILKIKQKNLISRLKRRNPERPLSANERKSRSSSKIILRLDDSSVPPLGYYKPDYDFVKPKASATCFYKASERKTIFDMEKPKRKSKKSMTRVMSATRQRKKGKKIFSRPQTSLLSRKGRRTRCLSPLNSDLQSVKNNNIIDPKTVYLNFQVTHKLKRRRKNRSSSSNRKKRCMSACKKSNILSTRVGSSNTTYTGPNADESSASFVQ